jgi:hypothetical protein
MASDNEEKKSFDLFELFTAILLGMGAIGGAWSAYQGDLWGGQSVEAYGEAATESTRASTLFNLGVTNLVRDLNLDIDAKQLIVEGLFTEDPVVKTRVYTIASYLYAQQMSDEAYAVMGLNARYRTAEGREGIDHIPEEELAATLDRELGENDAYIDSQLEPGTQGFASADTRFDTGRHANEVGDEFAFIGVLFTVALFLAGIALVFKSRVRWLFAGLGLGMLLFSGVKLVIAPWAGSEPQAEQTQGAPAEEEPSEEEPAEEAADEEG